MELDEDWGPPEQSLLDLIAVKGVTLYQRLKENEEDVAMLCRVVYERPNRLHENPRLSALELL